MIFQIKNLTKNKSSESSKMTKVALKPTKYEIGNINFN